MTSKFNELLERAKGLLSVPKPANDKTDAVPHDRFDERLYRELLEDAPALAELVEDIGLNIDYADDLVRDTLMQLWQGDPQVRHERQMKESHLINHAVATDVSRSESLAKARTYTMHDRYGAAMATIGVAEEVREYAEGHARRLKEAAEEAEKAKQEREEAEEHLRGCMPWGPPGDGEGEPGDGEGQGPGRPVPGDGEDGEPTEQQLMDLEAAIAAAEAAQQAHEDARAKAEAEAQQARQDLRNPTSKALRTKADELEEETDLFRAWGVEEGELQSMDFEERRQLASTLRGSKLAQFTALVGRFKLMAAAQRVRKIEYGRDQVVGTELSGDLSRVVMTEFTALAMGEDDLAEMLELDFYRRWFEDQLLSREFEGEEKVGKGAIIAVWDESGSMGAEQDGVTREAWAKAFALALLDTARQQRRDFVGIGFASANQQVLWRFPKGKGEVTDILKMVEHFFGGGTNFENPVDMAVDVLEEEFNTDGKMKGDIVFITDDDCMVTPDWLSQYLKRKERLGFRTFGMAIGSASPAGALAAMSDNVRAVAEFTDPSTVRDVFQVL